MIAVYREKVHLTIHQIETAQLEAGQAVSRAKKAQIQAEKERRTWL